MRNALTALTFLLLVLPALAAPVSAQNAAEAPAPAPATKKKPPPVNVVAFVGQGNTARSGRPTPVRVVMDNNEKAVSGFLELRSASGARTRMPVDLPRGAHKEYTLLAPLSQDADNSLANPAAAAELSLVGDGKVLDKQLLTPKFVTDATVVVEATDGQAGLQYLNEGGNSPFRVSQLAPRDLPRQWSGYEPADVVAMSGGVWSQLEDDQRRAFRMWVEHGGRAILCGEVSTQWADPEGLSLAGVVPRDVAPVKSLNCVSAWGGIPYRAKAGTLLTVSGALTPAARPLFHENSRPLIVRKRALLGQVIWIGFDAFRETVRDWDGYRSFWRRAVDEARKPVEGGGDAVPSLGDVKAAQDAAGALPRLPAPPLTAVIGFGIAYALIFGPLNVWMLRRLRRTVKSWLFTPSLAAVMTLVALVVGQQWGNARTVLNTVAVLETASGSRSAHERSLIGLFSPTNRTFDLSAEDWAPTLQFERSADPQDTAEGIDLSWPAQQSEGTVHWEAVALQLFSVRMLQLQRPVDLGGSIDVQLAPFGGGRASGTVRNGAYFGLRNAYLCRNGRYYWLGEIPPGGQVAVKTAGWSGTLPARTEAAAARLDLVETQTFRARMGELWSGARDSLITEPGRSDVWLVAECPDHRTGLTVGGLPYSNHASLLLARVPDGGGR